MRQKRDPRMQFSGAGTEEWDTIHRAVVLQVEAARNAPVRLLIVWALSSLTFVVTFYLGIAHTWRMLIYAVVAIATSVLLFAHRYRSTYDRLMKAELQRRNRCTRCGYDLRGGTNARCSECGFENTSATPARRDDAES